LKIHALAAKRKSDPVNNYARAIVTSAEYQRLRESGAAEIEANLFGTWEGATKVHLTNVEQTDERQPVERQTFDGLMIECLTCGTDSDTLPWSRTSSLPYEDCFIFDTTTRSYSELVIEVTRLDGEITRDVIAILPQ
jgi:hypothetical protein